MKSDPNLQTATEQPVKRSAAEIRAEICLLLVRLQNPTNAYIADCVGCSTKTVSRIRSVFLREGEHKAAIDGRANNGRKPVFVKAWLAIDEIRAQFQEKGGRDLHFELRTKLGFNEDEIPSIDAINNYISRTGKSLPQGTKIGQQGQFWLEDKYFDLGDRVGMDEVYPFKSLHGHRLKVVDVRDAFTGTVYGEPFTMDSTAKDPRGLDGLEFARVLLAWVQHANKYPRELILDNGGPSIIHRGILSEVTRHCIEMGTICTWEPYGHPTMNAHVERWHRELQKQYRNYYAERKPRSANDVAAILREICLMETFFKSRHNLPGKKAPGDIYPMRPWPYGSAQVQTPAYEAIGRQHTTKRGWLRMHRRVESYGVVQLHGADFIRISNSHQGHKVRIDFQVEPGGGGVFSVLDYKGNIVATGEHLIDKGCKSNDQWAWVTDIYGSGKPLPFSSQAYDETMRRMHKNDRSAGFRHNRDQFADEYPAYTKEEIE